MTSEKAQSERAIFKQALELPPSDRGRYLDEVCRDDTALRQDVDSLLEANEAASGFMERPALDQPGEAVNRTFGYESLAEQPGSIIGPYKLLQQIGEGGMGVVFMAEQTEPIQRTIALKIIKPGMDTRQVIARFEAERQALAMMDHPNIARVLDAGTTDTGRPYFVMDLVKGVPITEYCDHQHLTVRQRLELMAAVCQAVQHAHQKGIIHRDLKPSNVLVAEYDGKPVPQIIDFGVAKATAQKLTERTMFTQFGQIVGTFEYMSPEQARFNQLDIDTRSDIYSLGVLLYELLIGSTPFERQRLREAAFDEVLRIIREEEPPKPSTRLSELSSPHAPPAEVLSADPVSGQAGSQREPASLASIAALRHTEPAKLTKVVRGELDWIVMKCLEKDRSRRYETASGLAADVQRYLNDEHVRACPPSAGYRLQKFARRNKRALTMLAIVAGAMLVLVGAVGWMVRDRSAREQEIAHDREMRQAGIKERVTLAIEEARKRHHEGRWKEALDAAKRAEALAAPGESDEESRQRAREVLGDMQMLANLEDVRVRSTQNEAGYNLKEEDSGNARTFREYGIDIDLLDRDEAARRIRARQIRFELAIFLDSWSYVRRRLPSQSLGPTSIDWKELLEIARLADPDPWRDRFRSAVLNNDRKALVELAASAPISSMPAETVDRLGNALLNSDAIEEAAVFLKKGQEVHPQDYWINQNLGICLCKLDPPQLDEAVRYFGVAVALRPESLKSRRSLAQNLAKLEKSGDDDARLSNSVELNPKVATIYFNFGKALQGQNQLDEAIAAFRKAIELDPKRTEAYVDLGAALANQNKLNEAIAAFRKATELDPNYALAQFDLGLALSHQKKQDDAIASFSKAIELDPNYAAAHGSLGISLAIQKKLPEAIVEFRKVIELEPNRALSHNDLGHALAEQNKLDDAITAFRKAIELDPNCAVAHDNLGVALANQHKLPEAIAAYRKAYELDPNAARYSQHLVRAHFDLGYVLQTQGKLEEAIGEFRKAIDVDPKNRSAYNNLGAALFSQGKLDEAIAAFSKAIELDPKLDDASFALALVLLKAGREAEFRQHCHAFLERAAASHQAVIAEKAAKVALALPVDGADFQLVCELADFAAAAKQPNSLVARAPLVKALAEYRRDRFDSANDWASRAMSANDTPPERAAAALVIQAMASARLQQFETARVALTKADELLKQSRSDDAYSYAWGWRDWIIAEHLRREADSQFLDITQVDEDKPASPKK